MAGPTSPVLDEAYIRTRARGGYNDDAYDTLGRGLSNTFAAAGAATVEYYDSVGDENFSAFQQRLSQATASAGQTNDLTSRPVMSRKQLLDTRAALYSEAALLGPDAVSLVSNTFDKTIGGELGVLSLPGVSSEEAAYLAALDKGYEVGGLGLSEDEAAKVGQMAMRHEAEFKETQDRINLAKSQLELDSSTFAYNNARIAHEAEMYAAKFQAEALQPLFQGIAQSDLSNPDVIATNKQILIQKQAEAEAALRQNLTELGVPASTQSQIMGNMNQQFTYQQDGLGVMAGLPAAQVEMITSQFQLSEIEAATLMGLLFQSVGPESAARMMEERATVIDGALGGNMGKAYIEYLSQASDFVQDLPLKPDENNNKIAARLVDNASVKTYDNAKDLETLAASSRNMVVSALGNKNLGQPPSDLNSQLVAVDLLSPSMYLDNLLKTNDRTAIAQVGEFHETMADRMGLLIGQITSQSPDITVETAPDGTIISDIESWAESLKDIGAAALSAPPWMPQVVSDNVPAWATVTGPLGSAIQGFNELADRSTYSQLKKYVDAFNKSVGALNKLSTNIPRGLRNNNPGNIKASDANNWVGEVPSSDPTFEQFQSNAYGIRAIGKVIDSNADESVRLFISGYAPSSENDVPAYLKAMENAGIDLDAKVSEVNKFDLTKAIIQHELGTVPFDDKSIEGALNG